MSAAEILQPVPRPRTVDEFLKIRPQLVDTNGAKLVSFYCTRCRQKHFTVEPCRPPCPRCGSTAARCHRPSEHDAQDWHAARWAELDRLSEQRAAAGFPVVARWAASAPTLFERATTSHASEEA